MIKSLKPRLIHRKKIATLMKEYADNLTLSDDEEEGRDDDDSKAAIAKSGSMESLGALGEGIEDSSAATTSTTASKDPSPNGAAPESAPPSAPTPTSALSKAGLPPPRRAGSGRGLGAVRRKSSRTNSGSERSDSDATAETGGEGKPKADKDATATEATPRDGNGEEDATPAAGATPTPAAAPTEPKTPTGKPPAKGNVEKKVEEIEKKIDGGSGNGDAPMPPTSHVDTASTVEAEADVGEDEGESEDAGPENEQKKGAAGEPETEVMSAHNQEERVGPSGGPAEEEVDGAHNGEKEKVEVKEASKPSPVEGAAQPAAASTLPAIPSPRYTSPRDLPIRLSELVRIMESEQKPGATKVRRGR